VKRGTQPHERGLFVSEKPLVLGNFEADEQDGRLFQRPDPPLAKGGPELATGCYPTSKNEE
jgi:hypothetical protein